MPAGRPRQFDIEAVLDGAVELFWEHGFQGLKVPQLVEHLGICRQSFYKLFGDKRSFFLRALERYGERTLAPLLEALADERDPLAALRGYVEAWGRGPCAGRGCLYVKTIDLARDDPDLARLLAKKRDRLTAALTAAVERAQASGQLAYAIAPAGLAQTFVTLAYGFGTLSALPGSAEGVAGVRAVMLGLLERWSHEPAR